MKLGASVSKAIRAAGMAALIIMLVAAQASAVDILDWPNLPAGSQTGADYLYIVHGGTDYNTTKAGLLAGKLSDPAANGILARTSTDTTVARTLTGTANQVIVTNGNGVSGNPTFSLPQDIHTSASPTFYGLTVTNNSVTGYTRVRLGTGVDNARMAYLQKSSENFDLDLYWSTNPTTEAGNLNFHASLDSGPYVVFFSGGQVGMGVLAVDANYIFQLPNSSTKKAKAYSWDTYSCSETKKSNIEPISDSREILAKIDGIRFDWNDPKAPELAGVPGVTVSAEDLEATGLPGAVTKNEMGEYTGINQTVLIPVLVQRVKELEARQESLEARIVALESGVPIVVTTPGDSRSLSDEK